MFAGPQSFINSTRNEVWYLLNWKLWMKQFTTLYWTIKCIAIALGHFLSDGESTKKVWRCIKVRTWSFQPQSFPSSKKFSIQIAGTVTNDAIFLTMLSKNVSFDISQRYSARLFAKTKLVLVHFSMNVASFAFHWDVLQRTQQTHTFIWLLQRNFFDCHKYFTLRFK